MCVNLLKLQELSQPTTGPCGEANGLLRPTCERSPTAQHISEFFSFLFHFVFSNFFCYILSLINRFPAVCIFMCTKWLQILYLVRSQTQFDILTHHSSKLYLLTSLDKCFDYRTNCLRGVLETHKLQNLRIYNTERKVSSYS